MYTYSKNTGDNKNTEVLFTPIFHNRPTQRETRKVLVMIKRLGFFLKTASIKGLASVANPLITQ